MNLLIKAECEKCGHTIQFTPEEEGGNAYANTCGVCENVATLTVSFPQARKSTSSTTEKAPTVATT